MMIRKLFRSALRHVLRYMLHIVDRQDSVAISPRMFLASFQ